VSSKNLKFSLTITAAMALILLCSEMLSMVNNVSAQVYPREETIIVPYRRVSDPTFYNFYMPAGAWVLASRGGRALLQEYFFSYDIVTGKLIPELATGYEYERDFSAMKLYLRRGVTWNDGVPFTSKDVVFTFNLLKEWAPKLCYSTLVKKWVKEVVALDDYTVLIKFTKPTARFHWLLTAIICAAKIYPIPEHVFKGKDPTKFRNWPNPVFTGPYRVIKSDADVAVYERRDDWWGIKVLGLMPQPKYVIYKNVGPAEKVAMALEKNELDLGYADYSVYLAAREKNPYLKMWGIPTPCNWLVDVNVLKYPLSIPEVRYAISYAINRTKVAEVMGGLEVVTPVSTCFPLYPSVQKFVFPDVLSKCDWVVRYDPEKSIKLLEGLGFKRGPDGIFVTPNGTRLSFEYLTYSEPDPMALAIRDDLKKIGIEITIHRVDKSVWEDLMRKGRYELAFNYASSPGIVSPYDWYKKFHSELYSPETPYYKMNPWQEEYDNLVDRLATMRDTDPEAAGMYKRLLEIRLRFLRKIPVAARFEFIIINEKYWTNWPAPMGYPGAYATPQWWWHKFIYALCHIRSKVKPPTLPPKEIPEEIKKSIEELSAKIDKVSEELSAKIAKVTPAGYEELKATVAKLKSSTEELSEKVESFSAAIDRANMLGYAGVGIGIIAIVIAIIAIARKPS